MYIIKNAVKNLGRNKGRNILIAVIIFIIIVTAAVATTITTTTSEIIKDYKSRFGSEVAIDLDYDELTSSGWTDISFITAQQSIDFGESDLLLSSMFEARISGQLTDVEVLDGDLDTEDSMAGSFGNGAPAPSGAVEPEMPNMTLLASSRTDISDEFKSCARKLIEGENSVNENECMISQQLAELNDLSIGDSLKLKGMGQNPELYTLTISGIFEDNTTDYLSEEEPFPLPWNNRHNEVFVSIGTITSMGVLENDNRALTAIYTLKDPDYLEEFQKELAEKGLPDYYKVTTDESGYNTVVGPVEEMAKVTTTFLIVILILGAAVLTLVATIAVRERKYEIGVLRAMGMTKAKVATGFLCESLIITIIRLALGLGMGTVVSQPVADTLLENQIEIAAESELAGGEQQQVGGSFSEVKDYDTLSEIDATMNGQAVAIISTIALILALLSSLSSILYITRFEPMKILAERN